MSRFTPRTRWKGTEPGQELSRSGATADDLLRLVPGNGSRWRISEPDPESEQLRDRLLVEATRRGLVAALAGTTAPGLIADSVGSRPLDEHPLVSVVVPLRNEQFTLEALYRAVRNVLERHDFAFELVFVDDGSNDGSAEVLRGLVAGDHRVRGLRLRRNFGKAAALATGFRAACGAWIVTLDADLQDDPEEIPRLLAKLCDGHDLVSGWKQRRRDPVGRRLASKTFNAVTRAVSGMRLHDFNCGLKGYSRECAQELADSCYGEQHRYLPVIAHSKGFNVGEVPVNHRERVAGRSRYGLERYVRGLLDLMTTVFLSRYARRPMHVFGSLGLLLLIPGAAAVLWLVFQKVALGASIGGRPLLILGAVMFLAGLQLILTGLVAEMVSRLPSLLARLAGEPPSFPAAAIYSHRREPEASPGEAADVVPASPVLEGTVTERHGEPAGQNVQ